jgi:phosphatidylglycerophosphate synthase
MDGNMARMFDMVTPFGDYLDHISDISKYSLIFATILWNNDISFTHKTIFAIVILILTFLTQIHFGCQEKSYSKHGSDSLSVLEPLCKNANYIKYTRFFGMGTTVLVFIIFVISFSFTRRKLFV